MKAFLKKAATFLLSVGLLAYVVMQIYPMLYSSVTTETVYKYSAYEKIDVDCIAIRNEVPVPLNTSNYVFYTVQNGTRVSNGGTIAALYASRDDALVKQQLEELDAEIATLKEIQTLGADGMPGLSILNTQISNAMEQTVDAGTAASVSGLRELRTRLVGFLNKKQTVTRKNGDFSERIAALQEKRNQLASGYKTAISSVKAPVAGYFVDRVDGMEGLLKVDDVEKMTTDNIRTALSTELQTENTAYAGKIVSDYTWYIACVVPGNYATSLGVEKSLKVRLPFVTDEEIAVTVVGCNRDENGDLAVIFSCVNMSEALSSIRQEKMEILLVEHNGLRVPKRAITTNANQEVGVYVRSGDIVRFRKIEQRYSDAADYVICTEETKQSGYLRLYDDVIIEGSNLYDGKLIR